MQPMIPYISEPVSPDETKKRSYHFYQQLQSRRSIRDFSPEPVEKALIETLIMTAASAPSGAHKQPWSFCAVSNPELKRKIRQAAEREEYANYHGRMSKEWLDDLAPLGTDWHKPFLETAPWLIVMFKKPYEVDSNGQKCKNYYVNESVGIAAGMLITAIHQAGLVTLTHTPSPMNFLHRLLKRPEHERPYLLLPVGYAGADATVPDLQRKKADEVIAWY